MKMLKAQAAPTAKGLQPEAAALQMRRCKGLCVSGEPAKGLGRQVRCRLWGTLALRATEI